MYSRFDIFCHKYERYGIRNLMVYIIIGNAAVFLLELMGQTDVLNAILFSPVLVARGEWWRVFTFVFYPPSSSPIFMIFVLYFYYWIGSTLEQQWGRLKFTIFYATGALASILFAVISAVISKSVFNVDLPNIAIGSAYLNMSLLLAFATLFPDIEIRLFFILPIKIKWLAILDAAILLLGMVRAPFSALNFLPLVALINYFAYFGKGAIKLFALNQKNARRTVKFKSEVNRARHERGYLHKCSVCGVTDVDSPETEFRYCSLCAGYQCYCSQHIFTHEHTK